MILFLPLTAMSAQIKSMNVIKAGPPVVHKDAFAASWNRHFDLSKNPLAAAFQVNPYSVRRPAILEKLCCDKITSKPASHCNAPLAFFPPEAMADFIWDRWSISSV